MHFDFLRSMAVTKETGRQSLPPRKKNFKVHANLIDLAGKKFFNCLSALWLKAEQRLADQGRVAHLTKPDIRCRMPSIQVRLFPSHHSRGPETARRATNVLMYCDAVG
ncbi:MULTISPECIES: hypothetical protein [Rhizobium]|uniref:Uncharacterized protein n=2 Tax=Rhizobium TaxID=379 RepID=A0A7X0A1B7_RHILE|nr:MULTISPECIES: hypothetical protein [Rhizobium]MBB5668113.1 hypothetical protein [Rhizobium leguminosarum]MBB6225442.1 hypothetical protein [Rhizobium leguminosarum]MBY4593467.1 hypothetical protein [Rhizobium redzepovicii]MBY4611779.1 hypothetical protein [Rhizobium croatiense]MBY4618167.1 hypothetical protein [Rhizobium redzepovicii]